MVDQPGVENLRASRGTEAHGMFFATPPAVLGSAIPLPVPDTEEIVAPAVPARAPTRPVRVGDIWRETLATCAAHSSRLLLLTATLAGIHALFAMAILIRPAILPAPIAAALRLAVETVPCTAIAWSGLRGAGHASITRRRLRWVIGARWRAFVPGVLIYSVLFLTATSGLSGLLREAGIDSPAAPRTPQTLILFIRQIVTREVVVQSIPLLLPNPGLPFPTSLDRQATLALANDDAALPACNGDTLLFTRGQNLCGEIPPQPRGIDQFGVFALLVAADILLRFRLVAALQPAGVWRWGRSRGLARWVLPELVGARVALRHGLVVAWHVWLLRVAIASAGTLFVVLPLVLVQSRLMPMSGPWDYVAGMAWVPAVTAVLTEAATVWIGALVVAFCTLYDARLFVALQRAERGE